MITLIPVTEDNWMEIASLTVKEHQRSYVAPAIGILARGYVYRGCNVKIFAFEENGTIVGMALVREFTDEPLGYDLQQFMIDRKYQNKGYGSQALGLILDALRKEGRYDHVELCVKKADAEAIRLYEKHGFTDSGYVDEALPDSLNMICRLSGEHPKEMDQRIVGFLIKAKRATYAGKGAETAPSRPESHDLVYRDGEYMYYDTYLGGDRFAGEEALWISGTPFWSMNYAGRVTGEPFSGDFLKEALLHVPEDKPYRGPREYTNGDYAYHCDADGSFDWFQGRETIEYRGNRIYECCFHGGLIR